MRLKNDLHFFKVQTQSPTCVVSCTYGFCVLKTGNPFRFGEIEIFQNRQNKMPERKNQKVV